jgi:outer membrane protein TolC
MLMRERSVRHHSCWLGPLTVLACLVTPTRANAQSAPPGQLTLNDAIQAALKNYPAIKERRARAQAADEGVGVARTAYLPRLDLLLQENRATSNNVFGLIFPQGVIPPISGPVLGTKSYGGVWASAAGVLLSWEAVDFGQRKAAVDVA